MSNKDSIDPIRVMKAVSNLVASNQKVRVSAVARLTGYKSISLYNSDLLNSYIKRRNKKSQVIPTIDLRKGFQFTTDINNNTSPLDFERIEYVIFDMQAGQNHYFELEEEYLDKMIALTKCSSSNFKGIKACDEFRVRVHNKKTGRAL